jgi:hypothetical protein
MICFINRRVTVKYITYYSTRKTIFYVKYKCTKCNAINIQKQEIITSDNETTKGCRNSYSDNMEREDAKDLANSFSFTEARIEMENITTNIQKGKYWKVHFRCKCSWCGYKPIWSRFHHKLPIKISVVSLMGFLLLLLQDIPINRNYIYLFGVIFVCLPLILQFIHYLFLINKVKKMATEYLPVCSCSSEGLIRKSKPNR